MPDKLLKKLDQERRPRKTKIVATVGPASRSPEMIRTMVKAGANVFRLNFSHGTPDEHLEVLKTIRAVSEELETPVGVLQDLAGPKIRITAIDDTFAPLRDGDTVELRPGAQNTSSGQTIYVQLIDPTQIMRPGHLALLADGIIALRAEEILEDRVICRVEKGGRIRSHVGIAFPDSSVALPATTDKDLEHLAWGIANEVDFVAISFVQNANDIKRLKEHLGEKGQAVRLIAKIERRAALMHIDEILEQADGLMVARGDLGLELPLERVPLIQRRVIEKANDHGVPVIVATQMLHSMITSLRPTRAEASDVATAVMHGTDAVMLSEETAIGENPVESVEYLGRIAQEAEQVFNFEEYKVRLKSIEEASIPDAVAYASCAAALKVQAPVLIACTETGTSARLLAKYRPQQTLYAVSSNPKTRLRLTLNWGVIPLAGDSAISHEDEILSAIRTVQLRESLPNGTCAVVTGGLTVGQPGATSIMQIRHMNARD